MSTEKQKVKEYLWFIQDVLKNENKAAGTPVMTRLEKVIEFVNGLSCKGEGLRWVKASEKKPKEGWHNGRYGGDECVLDVNNGEIIVTFPNGIIENNPDYSMVEYLESSLPATDSQEWVSVIESWVKELSQVEGKVTQFKHVGRQISVHFKNGNAYWLRLDKQGHATLD